MFSVTYVLIAALAFWLLLAGLQRFVWGRKLLPAGPGDEPTIRWNPSEASLVTLAYAAATAKVNGLAGTAK